MARFLLLALLLACPCLAAEEPDLGPFNRVDIKACSTSFYVATVSMEFKPFGRVHGAYVSTYTARVFPLFYTERGTIAINVDDADIARCARGESVDFKGKAVNGSGDGRRVEGRATPTGPRSGKIQVKVIISRRIVLTYDTTYELTGTGAFTPTRAQ
jgi:hypothetical protein